MSNAVPSFGGIASKLVANGYRPVPTVRGQKAAVPNDWTHYEATPTNILQYARDHTGILTRDTPGCDIDVRDERIAEELDALAVELLGPAPRRIGQAPKRLLLYRTSAPFPKLQTAGYQLPGDDTSDKDYKPHKVEFLADGQQFIAYGIHQRTGKPYTWNGLGDPMSVPAGTLETVTEEKARAYIVAAEAVLAKYGTRVGGTLLKGREDDPALRGDPTAVRSALAAIPNDDLEYLDWVAIGYAIRGALGDGGLEDWLAWSAKSTKYVEADARAAWASFRRPRTGAKTLQAIAREYGWPGPEVVDVDWEALGGGRREGETASRLGIIWARDASHDVNVDYVAKGILARGELAVVYGAPKSGKTFLALDLAMSVAYGRPWFDHRVRGGTVVYLAAEMGKRVLRRVRAWMDNTLGETADHDPPFAVVPVAVNLLDAAAVARLLADIRTIQAQRGEPALIVVDTLARSMTGGDENSAQDMGRALSIADRLRDEFNAATLVVHHQGKTANGARGSSALLGAVDTMIRVDHDQASGARAFEVEWCRDGEAGQRQGFSLRRLDLGVDDDGDQVSTCLIEPTADADVDFDALAGGRARPPRMHAAAQVALRTLRDAIADHGELLPATSAIPPGKCGVTLDQWRARYHAVVTVDATDDPVEWRKRTEARRKVFERARDTLLSVEAAGTINGYWWLT